MKDPIETIWKEGFLNEKSLVAPRINDLYNKKSNHLVDRMKRMFRINQRITIGSALIIPLIYYVLDALWFGVAASVLLLLTAWYNKNHMESINTVTQGASSFDYLRSLDRWLKDILEKSAKVVRFAYPLYFLIASGMVWSTWLKQMQIHQQASNMTDDVSLFGLIIILIGAVLMFLFSEKIYRWDVRLMYGRVLDKLHETIVEMDELRKG